MKLLLFLVIAIVSFWSCTPCGHCAKKSNYIKSVNLQMPFNVGGKYCIAATVDTVLEKDTAIISFTVFDRLTGKESESGALAFVNGKDTIKVMFGGGNGFRNLPSGNYFIYVTSYSPDLMPFKIKKIELRKNTKMHINIYLGNIQQS